MVYKRKAREAQERHSGKRHRTSPSPTPSAPDPASESPEATPPPEVSEAPQHDPQTAVEMTEELADLIVERLNAPHNPTTNYSGAQPNFKAFRSKARGHHGGEAPRTQVLCVQESELTQVQISQRQQAASKLAEEAKERQAENHRFDIVGTAALPRVMAKRGAASKAAPQLQHGADAEDIMLAGSARGQKRVRAAGRSQKPLAASAAGPPAMPQQSAEPVSSLPASLAAASQRGQASAAAKPVRPGRKRGRGQLMVD